MDMCAKVKFEIDSLTVQTYTKHGKQNTYTYKIHELENITFSFNEFDTIEIRLDGSQYEVKIDCASYYVNNELKKTSDLVLQLQSGLTYTISKNGDFDIGYNPGEYFIYIKNKSNHEFKIPFDVKSTFDKDINIANVYKGIEKYIEGSSLDFSKKSFIKQNANNQFVLLNILTIYYKEFESRCKNLVNSFETKLESEVLKDKYQRKENLTSIRKSILSSQNYSVKKVLVENGNPYLKRCLMLIKNQIKMIDVSFETKIKNISNDINTKITSLNNLKISLDLNSLDKLKKENNIKSLEKDIKSLENNLDSYNEWFNAYNSFLNTINRVLNLDVYRKTNVCEIFDYYNISNNPDLSFIKELTSLILFKPSKLKLEKNIYYSQKKSSIVFEIYGLIIIYETLISLGYQTNDLNFSGELLADSEFIFEKENKRVVVKYDHYAAYYKDAKAGEIVSVNSNHNKPDYSLVFFENDEVKDIVIVEMKYRNLFNLLSEETLDTSLDYTINDYYQLAYIDSLYVFPKRIVRDVVLIYPTHKNQKFKRGFSHILGFNPNEKVTSNVNFDILKNILDK